MSTIVKNPPTFNPVAVGKVANLCHGHLLANCTRVVTMLRIPDILAETGPLSAAEIAKRCTPPQSPRGIEVVLRILTQDDPSHGMFSLFREENDRFSLTENGEVLRRDHPSQMWSYAELVVGPVMWPAWGNLAPAVESGKHAFGITHNGMEVFDYLMQHPDAKEIFFKCLGDQSERHAMAILEKYDFSKLGPIVMDVGGAEGYLLVKILENYPHLRGVIFDQSHMIENAKGFVAAHGMKDRISGAVGNFFTDDLPSADTIIMKHVPHDWNDEDPDGETVFNLFHACRKALKKGSTMLVMEHVISKDNKPQQGKFFDLVMFVMQKGKERHELEWQNIAKVTGFEIRNIIPTHAGISVIEMVSV